MRQRMHLRLFWFVCAVFVLACEGQTPPPPVRPPVTRPPVRREPPVVQDAPARHEFQIVDSSRATPGDPKTPQRTLRTFVWLGKMNAEQAGRFPLLVMAHGLNGSIERFDAIAKYIASFGITVAAPAFPLSHEAPNRKPATGITDLKDQPGDVSFVIDWLLKQVKDKASQLYKRFDASKIIGLGHSFGGATMLGLSRYDCCRDKRFLAMILVAPSTQVNALAFKAPKPASAGPPTLLIHGEQDSTLQYSGSLALYESFDAPTYFVGLPKAGHSDLIESQSEPPISVRDVTQRLIVAFVKSYGTSETTSLTKILSELSSGAYEVKQRP